MTKEERLLVISKLAFIGYYTQEHVNNVVKDKATWNPEIINNIK